MVVLPKNSVRQAFPARIALRIKDLFSSGLVAALPNVSASELTLACLHVIETNNMTSNTTALEAAMSPELN